MDGGEVAVELSDILGNFDAGHREVRFQALGPEEPGQESVSEPGGEGRG